MSDTLAPRRDPLGSCGISRCLAGVVERCKALYGSVFASYRPELHYMRGPGPKWREKHQARRPGENRLSASNAVERRAAGTRSSS